MSQFNTFYINMSHKSKSDKQLFRYSTYKKSSQILCKIQRYASYQSLESMPTWLATVIECSCQRQRGTKLLLVSIEAFISILESQSDDPNLKRLQQLILPRARNNYCMDIIKTLWSLLDDTEDHEKIV